MIPGLILVLPGPADIPGAPLILGGLVTIIAFQIVLRQEHQIGQTRVGHLMLNSNTTIQDIADRAKVSKATVSRVLNNSTAVNEDKRQAALDAMQVLGFQPSVFARGLASGQSMMIGVLNPKYRQSVLRHDRPGNYPGARRER